VDEIKGRIFVNSRAIIERIVDGQKEVVVQLRTTTPYGWEFPGGRIEPYESFHSALRREVKEETGLEVTSIVGEYEHFEDSNVECIKPFIVTQTLEGYCDSIGVHFICHVVGELLFEGDGTKNIKWINLDELYYLIKEENFTGIDRVAAIQYLKENNKW
jgi:8-oxo-dGTP pyrophosphatase MutT (NUDIX family)